MIVDQRCNVCLLKTSRRVVDIAFFEQGQLKAGLAPGICGAREFTYSLSQDYDGCILLLYCEIVSTQDCPIEGVKFDSGRSHVTVV